MDGLYRCGQENDPDTRRKVRLDPVSCHVRKDGNALAERMSRMITHMGANIRAYHFLCFQTQLGYRKNDPITLVEVQEVMPMVIKQGWLTPATRDTYDKYWSGGNLHLLH